MSQHPYSCEVRCPCDYNNLPTQLIVVTGGPGAGKTAVLEYLRKVLCEHVTILPEAASILFSGGFWRLKTPTAKMCTQRAIYHVQSEMQKLVLSEKRWSIGLCDRGTLDGFAYWPQEGNDFCTELKTTIEKEYSKYTAVIHLNSPSLKGGYNHQNPMRTESAEEALEIDERIHDVWRSHPNYNRIESSDDFIEKMHRATLLVFAQLPECCRNHLKGFSQGY